MFSYQFPKQSLISLYYSSIITWRLLKIVFHPCNMSLSLELCERLAVGMPLAMKSRCTLSWIEIVNLKAYKVILYTFPKGIKQDLLHCEMRTISSTQ